MAFEPVIRVQDIHRVYETAAGRTHALRSVSFSIAQGEFVAIMGPSGSGKSTLMHTLGCLDSPSSGSYFLEGRDIARCTQDELADIRATRIGFVFQAFNLLPRTTVLRNVMLPLLYTTCPVSEREAHARAALAAVALPEEYYEHKSNEISGGQMQRVAIARALINDPEILLADEPTGALDSKTSVQIMDLLTEIAADRLVIMVTHNPELAERYATHIVNLADGELIIAPAAPPSG